MRLKLQLIVLLWAMMSLGKSDASSVASNAINILKLIHEVTARVLKVWELIDTFPKGLVDNILPISEDNQHEIRQQMDELNDRMRHVEELQAEYFAMTIETTKRMIFTEFQLSHKIDEVRDMSLMISRQYSEMLEYQIAKDTMEPFTLIAFAEWCVKPGPTSLTYLVDMLHDCVFGDVADDSTGTLYSKLVARYETDNDQMCTVGRSSQQFAYDLYVNLEMTELKAYIMMEYSWMELHHSGRGNFTQELTLMRNRYEKRVQHSRRVLVEVMARSSRVYWRCDPKPWQLRLGQSYDHVTRLLQGYVENEINLNAEESCSQSCEDYQNAGISGCYGDELCRKQPKCAGRLHSCRFIDADMSVCQSNQTLSPLRRYDFIAFDNGRVLGTAGNEEQHSRSCDGRAQRAESWTYWFWRCNYCFCLCDEAGPLSDRFFNLRMTQSDSHDNMIVTGARFVKDQRVFHLQLQQGQLLPGGLINQSSLAWIPLDSYDPKHADIRNGFDYHELSYESRSIDLDEITTANDSLVVTGARFRVVDKHINLEVRFTAFNFSTGRLEISNSSSFWLGNDKTKAHEEKPREKLMLYDPQVSTKSPLSSLPLSKDNQFMEFVSSSEDKDAAQSTVPFIDIQEVVPNPAMPLSGLGIYHKGRKGFGGFFAPKVVTYDFLQGLLKP
ncbi:hypothetical protein KR222_002648 [Zaprionus bogoriensis]|nr:hypothetical protein KR222_002648 [Zaprionus bogoriensis]